MKLYRKIIKPVLVYPDSNYITRHRDLENKWYPEEKEPILIEKYKHLNNNWDYVTFEYDFIEVNQDEFI